MLLAERDVRVLVHGHLRDPKRVTSAEIFHDLGLTCATSAREIEDAWSRREPAFIGIAALCPKLARLIEVRQVVGLRNSGHTIAKLLPICSGGRILRVVNYTHPEYGTRLAEFVAETRADVLLMRGTEGEPVADARRLQKMDVYLGGVARPELSLPGQAGVVTELPVLPRSSDRADDRPLDPGDRQRRDAGAAGGDRAGRLPGARARRARSAGEPEGFGLKPSGGERAA
jgi:anthranilate phosphoribosyltransferase